jgi:transposase
VLGGVPPAPTIEEDADVGYWRARAERAEARAERAEAQVAELTEQVKALQEQVAVLGRMLFSQSSEKRDRSFGGGQDDGNGAGEAGETLSRRRKGQRPGGKGHGRRDYSHLDTREIIHEVPEDQRRCAGCGCWFEVLGFEDSEQIDWHVQITRIVHRRSRYRRRCSCPGCPRTVVAPAVAKAIGKGRFTTGFLARLLHEKYVLARPLHRIGTALAAEGFQVADGTLSGALKAVHPMLATLEEAIRERNAASAHLHTDETTWRVFEHVPGKDGNRWWLWVMVGPDTTVFVMDPSRSASVLRTHLDLPDDADALPEGRRLLLSSDFYAVYQSLAARIDGVDPLWCWSHVRRYFIRAGDAHPEQLGRWRDAWLERFAELYTAHRALAATTPGTTGHARAQSEFDTALAAIDTARHDAGPGLHPAARKVLDTLNREWDGLARHADFPDLPLDNNTAERALRGPVVGRKNYYGSATEWAAHLAASVWTIAATAERHGHQALHYLTCYLNACAAAGSTAPTGADLEALLPWNLTPSGRDHDPPDS